MSFTIGEIERINSKLEGFLKEVQEKMGFDNLDQTVSYLCEKEPSGQIQNRIEIVKELNKEFNKDVWEIKKFDEIVKKACSTISRKKMPRVTASSHEFFNETNALSRLKKLVTFDDENKNETINKWIQDLFENEFKRNKAGAGFLASVLLSGFLPGKFVDFRYTRIAHINEFFGLNNIETDYGERITYTGKLASAISKTIVYKKYFPVRNVNAIIGGIFYLIDYRDDKKLKETLDKEPEKNNREDGKEKNPPLNQILYGPPGTGKTYSTVEYALKILGGSKNKITSIQQLKEEFPNQVEFVTFHQSFSYEDFVEGLKAKSENGQLDYSVEDGVFKEICKNASSKSELISTDIKLDNKITIWKMSLGNSQTDDADRYFEEALDSNSLILGWGGKIDFTTCNNKEEILNLNRNGAEFVNLFIFGMKVGDIVVISDGNYKFKAIARIIGDYRFDGSSDLPQKRKIEWLQIFSESRPVSDISKKNFTQSTINKPRYIENKKLQEYLRTTESIEKKKKYILIIDEINRGNISRIFGELITLIEESKRAGNSEEISVQLPYSKKPFSVPNNLYIIGTMNTADRSLAVLDTALRRRFDFIEMMPKTEVMEQVMSSRVIDGDIDLIELLEKMNKRIEVLYDREHTIGHAFFLKVINLTDLQNVFENKILPLLEEYFYDDWEKIRLVLADKDHFYQELEISEDLFFEKGNDYKDHKKYKRKKISECSKEAFIQIYDQ